MSIAQRVQLQDLTDRLSAVEQLFRDGAEVGNYRARLDNLESTVSSILHELQKLSRSMTPTNEAGTKDPQGAKCPSSVTTKSEQLSASVSAAVSMAATQNSGQAAKMPSTSTTAGRSATK